MYRLPLGLRGWALALPTWNGPSLVQVGVWRWVPTLMGEYPMIVQTVFMGQSVSQSVARYQSKLSTSQSTMSAISTCTKLAPQSTPVSRIHPAPSCPKMTGPVNTPSLDYCGKTGEGGALPMTTQELANPRASMANSHETQRQVESRKDELLRYGELTDSTAMPKMAM